MLWMSLQDNKILQDVLQAADAVSAYTEVKMKDALKLKIPKSECPDVWIRLPRHKWPTSWSNIEDPVAPIGRNVYGHPLGPLVGKDTLRMFHWDLVGQGAELGMLVCSQKTRIIIGKKWMTSGKQNSSSMWKKLISWLILENQHCSLTTCTWGCTQRKCTPSDNIIDQYRKIFGITNLCWSN